MGGESGGVCQVLAQQPARLAGRTEAQGRGWVVCRDDVTTGHSWQRVRTTTDIRQPHGTTECPSSSSPTEGDENARIEEAHLLLQPAAAVSDFELGGGAVARRAALQHVGDRDGAAVEPDLGQQRVQQLSGAADKGPPGCVLVRPRRFTDEQQGRAWQQVADHDMCACGSELGAGNASAYDISMVAQVSGGDDGHAFESTGSLMSR